MLQIKRQRRETWWESLLLRHEAHTPRPDWHKQAACRGTSTDLFHDDNNFETAYMTCVGCPVILDCGAEAYKHETESTYYYGVWGGVPPWYRRRWHKQLKWAHRGVRRALSA